MECYCRSCLRQLSSITGQCHWYHYLVSSRFVFATSCVRWKYFTNKLAKPDLANRGKKMTLNPVSLHTYLARFQLTWINRSLKKLARVNKRMLSLFNSKTKNI